jgi:hypothetical protein
MSGKSASRNKKTGLFLEKAKNAKNFNVFHVRALYYTKTLITNKCTKSFFINCNTLLHVSTLLVHLQGELSVLRCFLGASKKQSSTQSTAHSRSTIKCNLSVTATESSPWRWPSRVETCRSVLQLMKKLFVHLLVIKVFESKELLREGPWYTFCCEQLEYLVIWQDSNATCRKLLETSNPSSLNFRNFSHYSKGFRHKLQTVKEVTLIRFSIYCFKSVTEWEEFTFKGKFSLKVTKTKVQTVMDNTAPSAALLFHLNNLSFTSKNE